MLHLGGYEVVHIRAAASLLASRVEHSQILTLRNGIITSYRLKCLPSSGIVVGRDGRLLQWFLLLGLETGPQLRHGL